MSSASNDPAARSSIVEILRQTAVRQPDRTAITYLRADRQRDILTYADLDRRARGIAAWLLDRQAKDQRVILAHPMGLDFIAAFFGCLYAGAQPVPQASYLRPRNIQKLSAVAADCQAVIALTDSPTLTRLAESGAMDKLDDGTGLSWAASDRIAPADGSVSPATAGTPSLAYLQYTSGSTSHPRGVRISHGNLMAHLRDLARAYRLGVGDVLVSWLPHFHDMGLVGMPLLSVYLGAHCVIFSTLQFIQRPARWLQAISDFHGTISTAPNFGYELCLNRIAPEERQVFDLSSWRVALNGAEPVRPGTHRRFLAAFAANGLRPEALSPCYGLAEATLMVSSSRPWLPARIVAFDRDSIARRRPAPTAMAGADAIEMAGCGPPSDGVRVAIVDPQDGRPVAEGAIGEIWVKGESVAEGYFAAPEATAGTFGARLADGDGPYLRTGDLGFFHDGELFIAGRIKDLIIVNGRNLYPQDIEQSVQSGRPALIAGRGAAFPIEVAGQERLVLVQELHRHAAIDPAMLITEIRAAILGEHDVHPAAIFLVKPGTVMLTSSGKLARHAMRELLLKGELATLAEWHDDDWPTPPGC
jgi:acyl-CoA synthetase (AMP-forming)/AMP-acid ligase II